VRSSVLGVGTAGGGGIMRKSISKAAGGGGHKIQKVSSLVNSIKKKVRFTDEVRGNTLATVYEVESYKNINGKPGG